MQHALQHLVMPNLVFGAPAEMYARLDGDKVHASMHEGQLLFETGGQASFDTFFNSVTVGAWKAETVVEDLYLHLRGDGRFIVRIGVHCIGYPARWLDERQITLTADADARIEIESWPALQSGMLFFALEAVDRGRLSGGCFATTTPPRRDVKLGIVITHFNRKQWVLPAIERIRGELLCDPLYAGRIELVVVDNSQNITSEEARGITLIPNQNLGGSGGFTRGLLYLKDRQDFTHCLFMDDDASCEIESIRRTFSLLAYARQSRLAVAGSLMRELEPCRLFEKGAKFNGRVRPLKSGLDMRHVPDLLAAENADDAVDYGAWWFFAFSVSEVRSYAFPFFVRGDDIRFGLENEFNILTLNGIGCWGPDFSSKSGPVTVYFDVRSHLVHAALDEASFFQVVKMLTRFIAAQLFSYNYSSAQSVLMAIEDFSEGPRFFINNLEMTAVRDRLSRFAHQEKPGPVNSGSDGAVTAKPANGFGTRLMQIITLNGYLLPAFLLRKELLLHPKAFRADLGSIFAYRRVLYVSEPDGVGYIATHDKKKFFLLLGRFFMKLAVLLLAYGSLARRYRGMKTYMMSEKFWRETYFN